MDKVLAIENHDGLCWKCLQSYNKDQIHDINIPEMGYGSRFDGEGSKLQLCNDCYQDSINNNNELWSMEEIKDIGDDGFQYGEEYKHEKEMLDYIETLPLQSKQFVWNEFNYGSDTGHKMKAQDWIDYKLDILPHDKCKEYGYYSLEEKQAYKERFPTCQYPINKVWDDKETSPSYCPFGSHGDHNQNTNDYICDNCYECTHYKNRTTPIKYIDHFDYEDYKMYVIFKSKEDDLIKKFGVI